VETGDPADFSASCLWYDKAIVTAKEESGRALFEMGDLYHSRYVKDHSVFDFYDALIFFRRAKEAGFDTKSQFGKLFQTKYMLDFQEDSFSQAERFFKEIKDCLSLGTLYYNRFQHLSNKRDLDQAIRYVNEAVEQGVPTASEHLVQIVQLKDLFEKEEAIKLQKGQQLLDSYKGSHKDNDFAEALKWLQPAAAQGSAEAKRKIGELYAVRYCSTAEDSDRQHACDWFREALQAGDTEAQLFLNIFKCDQIISSEQLSAGASSSSSGEKTQWYVPFKNPEGRLGDGASSSSSGEEIQWYVPFKNPGGQLGDGASSSSSGVVTSPPALEIPQSTPPQVFQPLPAEAEIDWAIPFPKVSQALSDQPPSS
jgi:TPR repeat protein